MEPACCSIWLRAASASSMDDWVASRPRLMAASAARLARSRMRPRAPPSVTITTSRMARKSLNPRPLSARVLIAPAPVAVRLPVLVLVLHEAISPGIECQAQGSGSPAGHPDALSHLGRALVPEVQHVL